MGKLLPWLSLVLLALLNFAGGQGEPQRASMATEQNTDDDFARYVLLAFQQSYPDRGMEVERRGDEWGIRVENNWYIWAGGRILPEADRQKEELFKPFGIYYYPAHRPPQPIFDADAERAFREMLDHRAPSLKLHRGFINDLYQIHSRAEAEAKMKVMRLGGMRVRLNESLEDVIFRLGKDLAELRKRDAGVDRFLRSIKSISGFNWRKTSYFDSVSYHSFGLALDLMPVRWNAPVYWYWSKDHQADWYNIPYSQRWQVPEALVDLFERYGFIWGGKWLFFDNMHFEYRPELLRLRNMPQELWPRSAAVRVND